LVWLLGPVERALVRWKVSPTLLNLVGAAAGTGAGIGFAADRPAAAAWLLATGGLADILDGRVARARRLVSRRGAFLDSTLDRFGETATFVGLAWRLAGVPWQAATVALALGGSLLVSYTRARGEALGVAVQGGWMQRPERVVLLILGALAESAAAGRPGWRPGAALAATPALLAAGTVGTALYRIVVAGRRLAEADAPGSER
jgi:CDP-diacylglycerol--glycerol-3-phosphate 3-phosphatidyltransferase